jgi:5-methylcytosine-specific restriction enzyme B
MLNFAQTMAENDLVLACEGQNVLAVGRVRGSYEYDGNLAFPHKRGVEWLLIEQWPMPQQEGLRTTVQELGKSAANLLEIERRLYRRNGAASAIPREIGLPVESAAAPLPSLDRLSARIEGILRRKGQVVLYGPPGTGKTYHALRVAKELAARHNFRKSFASLSEAERVEIIGSEGSVRLCTFHPDYGYEDFLEGLRPRTVNGQMVFEPRDGIFKRMCTDALDQRDHHFFLVVDEINRGDVPRIFGELITVIEHDKRGMPITLPLTDKPFAVPRNVFLVGTMNTADRSISLLDTALRRRFGFVELMPDSSQLAARNAAGLPLGAWLDAGHAYLLPPQPITSLAEFARVVRDDIIPLLEEYCYEDFDTLKEILGAALVDTRAGRIREEMFEPNREDDLLLALSFEEVQPLVLAQGLADGELEAGALDGVTDDGEDVPDAGP